MRFSCDVSAPTKKGDNALQQHTTYTIVTAVFGDNGETTSTSIRRFSDFVWLQQQLNASFQGHVIPPLPEKAIIGRFEDKFVAERMRAMTKFLNRIGSSEEMAGHPSTELFVNADESTFSAARGKVVIATEDGEELEEKTKKKGFFEKASEAVTSLSNQYGPGKEREKSDADIKADNVVAYVVSLEKSLSNLAGHAETLVKADKDLAKNYFELGLAFTELGQYETEQDESKLGGIYASVGSAADSISVLTTEKMEKETIHLKESVKDGVRMAGAVKAMIGVRTKLAVTHQTQTANLIKTTANLVKLQDKQGKDEKAQALEATLATDQAKLDATKTQLDMVSDLALKSTRSYREEKGEQARAELVEFVKSQIQYHDQVMAAWKAILPNLDSAQGEGAGEFLGADVEIGQL